MNRTQQEISAGAVIFRRDAGAIKFLLLYHGKGYWNFPKGKLEKGEQSYQAFLREVEEETGIARRDMKVIPGFRLADKFFFTREKRPIFKIVIFYLVETRKLDIKVSDEHEGYGWFLPGDAVRISKFRNSKEMIRKAYNFIKNPKDGKK
ncbi:MAG: NUDIX domain-containing protein [bacterium]|nr:NUDIX domain-containing protein [bacterium]